MELCCVRIFDVLPRKNRTHCALLVSSEVLLLSLFPRQVLGGGRREVSRRVEGTGKAWEEVVEGSGTADVEGEE